MTRVRLAMIVWLPLPARLALWQAVAAVVDGVTAARARVHGAWCTVAAMPRALAQALAKRAAPAAPMVDTLPPVEPRTQFRVLHRGIGVRKGFRLPAGPSSPWKPAGRKRAGFN